MGSFIPFRAAELTFTLVSEHFLRDMRTLETFRANKYMETLVLGILNSLRRGDVDNAGLTANLILDILKVHSFFQLNPSSMLAL